MMWSGSELAVAKQQLPCPLLDTSGVRRRDSETDKLDQPITADCTTAWSDTYKYKYSLCELCNKTDRCLLHLANCVCRLQRTSL